LEGTLVNWWRAGEPESGWQEEFTAATRAFLTDGGEPGYCVGVKIALAALPGSPARHGDPQ
jgi:hypothetical protein